MPCDGSEKQRGVAHAPSERADLVERGREGDQAIARDAAVGGLEPHHAAEGGGLANRTAGIRSQGACGHPGGDCRRRPARRASGHAREVPRIAGELEGRVLGGRPHSELVHVRLAQEHGAGVAETCDHGRVVGRHEALEDPGATRRGDPARAQDILDGHGHAVERATRYAPPPAVVGGACGGHRRVAHQREVRAHARVDGIDAIEIGTRGRRRGGRATGVGGREGLDGQAGRLSLQ